MEQTRPNILALPKEDDYNDSEYKLILHIDDPIKRDGLITQMKYRLAAGMGECIYYLGVKDSGDPEGITTEEMDYSLKNLDILCREIGADWSIIQRTPVQKKEVCSVMVRENNNTQFIDLKIAVIGNVDSGKSTFLGVLVSSKLDDGAGSARVNIFNHRHEIETGRTSSQSFHIIGFDSKGGIVDAARCGRGMQWPEIVRESKKIVTFVDLPGHQKYLKTAMRGFSAGAPDYAIILVGANMGAAGPAHQAGSNRDQILNMTREHILMCLSTKIPFMILLSKIDIAPEEVLKQTIQDIKNMLQNIPNASRVLYEVKSETDIMTAIKTIGNKVVPMIRFSSKTGENLGLIKKTLNLLPLRVAYDEQGPLEISTIETFSKHGIGTILHGFINRGLVKKDDEIMFGPDSLGNYAITRVKSLHLKRMPVTSVGAGHHVCLALHKVSRDSVRRGMMAMKVGSPPVSVRKFEADVYILKTHCTTIRCKYEPVLNMGNIRQVARIIKIDDVKTNRREKDLLRPGDRSIVEFEFKFKPEYVLVGTRFFFSEGQTRGVGVVTAIIDDERVKY